MTTNNSFIERRRAPRFQVPPAFKAKARVKIIGADQTHYFLITTLSMTGMGLLSQKDLNVELAAGKILEVLIFRKNLSFRVMVEIVGNIQTPSPQEISDQKLEQREQRKKLGTKIVGIDKKAQETLAQFLEEIARTAPLDPMKKENLP